MLAIGASLPEPKANTFAAARAENFPDGKDPDGSRAADARLRFPCVPHRHARRACWNENGQKHPMSRHFPRVAGGRPISANPFRKDLRRLFPPSAGPASPARLPVYPLRDERIIGARAGGGENAGGDFFGGEGRQLSGVAAEVHPSGRTVCGAEPPVSTRPADPATGGGLSGDDVFVACDHRRR